MNNTEIKQGDKVRVSKDAPKIYTHEEDVDWFNSESIVTVIDGDAAEIKFVDDEDEWGYIAIPTKYLVKVDAEAKEAKFKVGDKVRYIGDVQEHKGEIFVIDGDIFFNDYYKQWQASSLKTIPTGRWSICNVPLSDLEPDTVPAAPKIKIGDRVRSKGYGLEAVVLGIDGEFIAVRRDDGIKQEWNISITELVSPTEQTEEEKPNTTIKIPVEVDLSDGYWDAYAADLAKEVALKVANKYNNPEQAAEYAVSVTKAVVEGLKRK